MALKPKGQQITIKEQIIEDAASGLTLVFEKSRAGWSSPKTAKLPRKPLDNVGPGL